MKALKLLILIGLMIPFVLISCDDEPVDPALLVKDETNQPVNSGTMTALVDGDLFTAGSMSGTYSALPDGAGNLLTITGIKPNGQYILIQIANPLPGTYIGNNNTAPETNITMSYREGLNADIFTAFDFIQNQPTGILKITSFNMATRKVSGTFNFVGHLPSALFPIVQVNSGTFTDVGFTLQ
ncbi:hypothetical protein KIH23_07205 [Flavobacterium sp. CYK-55]|uniref:DUF6252 family protein n=1 Tax=Flavobacterium sp. CYK-55 TaxID=2835529 RepID=UPI001BD14AC5|nr:DUF6252 family protein [Flavobacterium sp. CYK-55]MBS7787081.1 hypothetical protein [Flavobacterium sp. CYK-55]